METMSLEVYSTRTNAAIIRPPGRRFPGVVLQGDTLHAMWNEASDMAASAATSGDDDLKDMIESHAAALRLLLDQYESVLREHNIPRPY